MDFAELGLDSYNENDDKEKDNKEVYIDDLLNTKISYKSKVMDIESVLNSLKRGDYILPKYQRKYVWEKAQAANLVLSLIKNIPIPPLYFYYDKDNAKYVVLDGQQRITSLFMYYNDIFYNIKNNREKIDFKDVSNMLSDIEYFDEKLEHRKEDLSPSEIKDIQEKKKNIYKKMKEKYNLSKTTFNLELSDEEKANAQESKVEKDITFSKFDDKAKRILRRKDLEIVFVECAGENSDNAYSQIFKLINSAGKELSSQEIRNGVYYNNALYDEIYKFNTQNLMWRTIYGAESSIYKDFEYILRFLALDYYTTYKNDSLEIEYPKTFSYSNIIDSFSEKFNRDINHNKGLNYNMNIESKAKEAILKLEKFFGKISDLNEGEKVSGRSLLLLEALFLAFSKLNLLDVNIEISYKEWLVRLKNKKEIKECISKSTTSKGTISKRISLVIEEVKKELDNEGK